MNPTFRIRRTHRRGPGRAGHAASSPAAVLRATSELLHEVGLQAMTTDEIAGRSGVSKATIYRWPNKYAVAVEAFLSELMAESSDPDTEAAREDLRSVASGVGALLLRAERPGLCAAGRRGPIRSACAEGTAGSSRGPSARSATGDLGSRRRAW
jgi:AcrR family transcriptional regulator